MDKRQAGFRILSHDEFEALSIEARIVYLREAIAALDELKGQLKVHVMHETGVALLRKTGQ
jgi:hypothetical protein